MCEGWLTSASTTPSGGSGSQVNLLSNGSYSGTGGAAGHLSAASIGNGTSSYSASYDDNLRLGNLSVTNVSLGTTLFATTRTYDAVGNVVTDGTTLPAGWENQTFCYDSLNRLTWAGSTGTPSCGRSLTVGTLTSAQYTASYSYDPLNRIIGGSLGTMTYGDSAHLHAATSSSSGETASYDAAGEMTCRAPTSALSCAGGSPNGASLTYDAERRVKYWQNGQNGQPITSQVWFMYDGAGNRVEQYVSGGSGNHSYYLPGNVEEVTPSNTLVKYYAAGGLTLGENTTTGSTGISYLASDGLGSVTEALNQTGTAIGSQLYGPYGNVRYSTGTMPTAKGFTGQYADGSTGLNYYGARYYDPSLGQFTSADTVADGLNRYGYVKGNPETYSDPSGHRCFIGDGSVCGGPGGSPPPAPPAPPTDGKGSGGGKTCNPDSAGASDACKARAYDNNKVRDDKLRGLQTSAYLKLIAGYLLVIFADAVDIIRGTTLAKLEALLDLGTTILNSLLPLLGQVVQNLFPQFHDVYQQMLHFGSALNGVLGVVRAAIGFVKQGNWIMQASINVAMQIATNAEAPVPGVLFTLAASFFGPALTNYMDAGAHEVIRSGLDDQAEWQRQKDMNIADWCAQYGGGACEAFPDH